MTRRLASPARVLDAFVAVNLLFLVVDIALAHASNAFRHPAEWIPLVFSAAGGAAVVVTLATGSAGHRAGRYVCEAVGWLAVAVGVSGLLWHLSGGFFREVALASLVYSAPFVAPLAYTGLGLLLLLNRRLDPSVTPAWGQWVLFLAFTGIIGNFGLSLVDHARNGFFYAREWVAVVGAALGVGAVLVAILWPRSRPARTVAWAGLGLQVAVGLAGFGLHLLPLLAEASSADLLSRVIYGPPPFAPLLFPNLALLGALGLWVLGRESPGDANPAA